MDATISTLPNTRTTTGCECGWHSPGGCSFVWETDIGISECFRLQHEVPSLGTKGTRRRLNELQHAIELCPHRACSRACALCQWFHCAWRSFPWFYLSFCTWHYTTPTWWDASSYASRVACLPLCSYWLD
jgi:hypothetical protein